MRQKIGLFLLFLCLAGVYSSNLLGTIDAILTFLGLKQPNSNQLELLATTLFILSTSRYICLTILIWLEREQLGSYHLDRQSLVLLVIFGTLIRTDPRPQFQIVYLTIIGVCCIAVLVIIVRSWSKIPKTSSSWSFRGINLTLFALISIIIIEAFQPELYSRADPASYNPLLDLVQNTFFTLSAASIGEEMIYRGFLWGYLEKLDWNEKNIMWTQAILFWLAHFSRITWAPVSFLISIPIGTFVLSKLTQNTKQVFWPIVYHTLINTVVPVFLTIYFLNK